MNARYKTIAASVVTTLLLVALAIPAVAEEPLRFHNTQTISTAWECPGGVLIPGTVTFNDSGIVLRDAAGNGTRLILHSSIDTSFIGPTGIVAAGTNVQNEILDLTTRTVSIHGVITNLKVAGVGIVAHVAGSIRIDANGATFTPSFDHAQPATVCQVLLP